MQLDIERRLALAELLAQPDPTDLAPRRTRLCLEGKPDRFDLLPLLAAAFVQRHMLELHERRAEADTAEADARPADVRRCLPVPLSAIAEGANAKIESSSVNARHEQAYMRRFEEPPRPTANDR
jgi:hypothetical protein